MKKIKKLIIVVVFVLTLIASGVGVYYLVIPKPTQGNEYFTLEPSSWIEGVDYTPSEEDMEINIFKATRGKSIFLDNVQQDYYLGDGDIKSFFYRGSYNGQPFRTVYLDDEFYNKSDGISLYAQEELAKDYLLMRISPEMNPHDGVINGFILARKETRGFAFYIFVDEDWKEKLEYTNILWGNDFSDPYTMNVKTMDFQKYENGIYYDKLVGNVDWHMSSPIRGGIVVGEIDLDILEKLINTDEINETFMYVR